MAPANIPFVILPVPTATTPTFDKLISPEIACAAATFDPFPIQILPSLRVVPEGFEELTDCVAMEVMRPLVSTVMTGTELELP